jgi:hypothetical protein
MVLSDKERASTYRYAGQVQRAAEKVLELIEHPPAKYQESFRLMPDRGDVAERLFDAASRLWNSDWHINEIDGVLTVSIPLLDAELPADDFGNVASDVHEEMDLYEKFVAMGSMPPKSYGLKMTRNAFCEQVLEAKLTNSRWGWVGVKESGTHEPGALYIFGWEHNKERDGEGSVGFFHSEVSVDPNTGRRRPGHRDALEKIARVQNDELEAFVVWQNAVDPSATPKTIDSINGEFVTRCELYIDDNGYWTGRLLDNVALPKIVV